MNIIKEIIEEFKNKWFLFYLFSIIVFAILFFKIELVTFKIISIILLIFAQLMYNLKVKTEYNQLFLSKFLNWTYFVLFILFGITYIAASVNEINVAVITLLFTFGAILLGALVLQFINLWKSKNIFTIIISYLLLAFIIIILFGYIFTILAGFPDNGIFWKDDSKVDGAWNYVYFSLQVFYSTTFGDIFPLGYSKLLVGVELGFSFVVHLIILSIIISRLLGAKKVL